MSRLTMIIGDQPLLLVLNVTLDALERKERMRSHAAEPGRDELGDIAAMCEDQTTMLLESLVCMRAALASTGGGMGHVDGLIARTLRKILAAREATPWRGSFDTARQYIDELLPRVAEAD